MFGPRRHEVTKIAFGDKMKAQGETRTGGGSETYSDGVGYLAWNYRDLFANVVRGSRRDRKRDRYLGHEVTKVVSYWRCWVGWFEPRIR